MIAHCVKQTSRGARRQRALLRSQFRDVPTFHLLSRPRSFAQERETGLHGGIELETTDRNTPPHLAPTVTLHELVEDAFERDAVQRIARMSDGFGHGGYVSGERRVRQRNVSFLQVDFKSRRRNLSCIHWSHNRCVLIWCKTTLTAREFPSHC